MLFARLKDVHATQRPRTVAGKRQTLGGLVPHRMDFVVRTVHFIWKANGVVKLALFIQCGHPDVQTLFSLGTQTVKQDFC